MHDCCFWKVVCSSSTCACRSNIGLSICKREGIEERCTELDLAPYKFLCSAAFQLLRVHSEEHCTPATIVTPQSCFSLLRWMAPEPALDMLGKRLVSFCRYSAAVGLHDRSQAGFFPRLEDWPPY